MAEQNLLSDMDAIHKANSVKIVAVMVTNVAKAVTIPANVGRTEPAMDLNRMQGTANGCVTIFITTQRT